MTAPAGEPATRPAGLTSGRVLILLGIVVLAVNLRPAAVSVGPVLDDVRAGLDMSGTEAGVLTALPVVAFAVFGAVAGRLASVVGPHRLTAIALACVTLGLLGRSRVDDVAAFLLLSLLALGGMATANVVLPSLVKQHFPDRIGTLTAVYSTALALGLTGASVLTVPVSQAGGGWRDGLALWSLVAAVALVPWLALLGRDRARPRPEPGSRIPLAAIARTRTGRL
ncbi:MAG: transporter, partial [Nocardioides sp.]|nr:transporter [Nocardioides sp.]